MSESALECTPLQRSARLVPQCPAFSVSHAKHVCISAAPKAERRLSLRAGKKGVHRRYGRDLVRGRLGDKGTLAVAVILDDPLT